MRSVKFDGGWVLLSDTGGLVGLQDESLPLPSSPETEREVEHGVTAALRRLQAELPDAA